MKIPFTLKQRKIAVVLLILISFIAIASAVIFPSLTLVEKEVTFYTHDIRDMTYGDEPDFSGFSIRVVNLYGVEKTYSVGKDDVDYNPDYIGTQTAVVKHNKKRQSFSMTIKARKLETPVVKIVNSADKCEAVWGAIVGAGSYKVYIDNTEYTVSSPRYDLSGFPKVGTLSVRVVAHPADGDKRYLSSETSKEVTITKLKPISNLKYVNGEFVWDKVEGAVGYSVTVNGKEARVAENKYGFTSMEPYYVTSTGVVKSDLDRSPLSMGGLTWGVSTFEMAAAYATFPRNGEFTKATTVLEIRDSNDQLLLDNKPKSTWPIKATTAYYMNSMLTNVVNSGTGYLAKIPGQTVAGKTGTTNNKFDLWFCGYTSYYTGAVWVGFKENEEINDNGSRYGPAMKLWQRVMAAIHEGKENQAFPVPDTLNT